MELAYAFLATSAELHDKKLFVFNGDFDSLNVARLPALSSAD